MPRAYYIFVTSILELFRDMFTNKSISIFELISSLPSYMRTLNLIRQIVDDISKLDNTFPFNSKNYGIAKSHILINVLIKYIQVHSMLFFQLVDIY